MDPSFTHPFRNFSIHCRYFPTASPKAMVILVHGMGEHLERYSRSVIPILNQYGASVLAYDNIGHGQSSGKRGHCPSYEALQDLLGEIISLAKTEAPQLPLFLYGHSMGGNLVLNYGLRTGNIDGIIASSPYLRLAFEPPKWKMGLGRFLLGILPGITLPTGLDPNAISQQATEVAAYKNDPLIHDKVSPMFSFPIMEAGEWAINEAQNLKTPTLLIHGTADALIDYGATEAFHAKCNASTLHLIDKGYHELHHDLKRVQFLKHIGDWLKTRLS
jgi:alpha-beta hydrolase superfamily lysophospholipase